MFAVVWESLGIWTLIQGPAARGAGGGASQLPGRDPVSEAETATRHSLAGLPSGGPERNCGMAVRPEKCLQTLAAYLHVMHALLPRVH